MTDTFSSPYGPLAPSSSHSSSALSIPIRHPCTVLLAFLEIFSLHDSVRQDSRLSSSLQQRIVENLLPNVPRNSPVYLNVGLMRGVVQMQKSSVAIVFNYQNAFIEICVEGPRFA